MKRVRSFFINTIILTASALVMRTISVAFNVYLSDKMGSDGIGLLQLIMTVYSFGITLASSGIRLASTRLIVESLGCGRKSTKCIMKSCIVYSLIFGLLAGAIMFLSANTVSDVFINNAKIASSLKILSVALPFLAVSAALGGYFTAIRKVGRISFVSFLEQIIKIALTVLLLIEYLPKGTESACSAVVIGSCIAEVVSFFMDLVLYVIDICKRENDSHIEKGITKKLISIAIPDAVSSYARSALVTIEHMLIPYGLRKSGASAKKSLADYGVVSAMALPVITFPTVLTYSVAGLLIPEIGESYAKGNYKHINYVTVRTLRIVLMFSIGTAGIMFSFGDDLGLAIYDNTQVAKFIRILAPIIPIMYLDTMVDGILKGMGEQLSSMRYNIIDSFFSVILVYTLVPKIAVNGYIITIFASEILNFYLSFKKLGEIADFRIHIFNDLLKPVFCVAGAVSMTKIMLYFAGLKLVLNGKSCFILIGFSFLIYTVSLYITEAVTREDVSWLKGIIKK